MRGLAWALKLTDPLKETNCKGNPSKRIYKRLGFKAWVKVSKCVFQVVYGFMVVWGSGQPVPTRDG